MKSAWLAMVVVATVGCGSEETDGGGGAGKSSSSSGASTGSTSSENAPQGSGGGGSEPGGGGGGSAPGAGGGLACGDETCGETERCQECISDDKEQDPFYTCWPSEAPEGEFVCGSTTCAELGQYCQAEDAGISTCEEYYCTATDPECESDDPCDCAKNKCFGVEENVVSCEVGDDGQVYVSCSFF